MDAWWYSIVLCTATCWGMFLVSSRAWAAMQSMGPSVSAICCWGVLLFVYVCFSLRTSCWCCWFRLFLQGKMGGDLCAPYCIAARVDAALVIQSSGGVLNCGPSCMIARVETALTMHSLGHFLGPQKGESSPRPAPSLCGGSNLGRLGRGGGSRTRTEETPPPRGWWAFLVRVCVANAAPAWRALFPSSPEGAIV